MILERVSYIGYTLISNKPRIWWKAGSPDYSEGGTPAQRPVPVP